MSGEPRRCRRSWPDGAVGCWTGPNRPLALSVSGSGRGKAGFCRNIAVQVFQPALEKDCQIRSFFGKREPPCICFGTSNQGLAKLPFKGRQPLRDARDSHSLICRRSASTSGSKQTLQRAEMHERREPRHRILASLAIPESFSNHMSSGAGLLLICGRLERFSISLDHNRTM